MFNSFRFDGFRDCDDFRFGFNERGCGRSRFSCHDHVFNNFNDVYRDIDRLLFDVRKTERSVYSEIFEHCNCHCCNRCCC